MSNAPARIVIVFTGGTIEAVGRDRLDNAWYIENDTRLTAAELLARLPELDRIAAVSELEFRKLPSHALTDRDLLDLLRLIHAAARDGADGVVVTHGTNTLEETGLFLHLALKCEIPVVLVGAMRPASAVSSDGDANLLSAVAVAASSEAHGKGVLVVLNDTILSARDATKTSTYRVQAFRAPDAGPLGYADADQHVVFYHDLVRPHTCATEFDVAGRDALPRVDVVVSYIGADGVAIDALVAAGARGIVSAATGAGRPTPLEDAALDRARAAGVAVCIASRVGSGRVVRSPGLARRGMVAADGLQPWKARMLLSLALTVDDDPDHLQMIFDRY